MHKEPTNTSLLVRVEQLKQNFENFYLAVSRYRHAESHTGFD